MEKKSGSVLIVDDVPENVRMLGELLEQEGYEVLVAESGERALDTARTNRLDLILLDIMMPGMDGYHVCLRLKADPATMGVPVIFLTALDSPEDEAKGLAVGAVDYIAKPFKVELVKARVDTHISLYRARERLEETVEARTLQLASSYRELENLEAARRELLRILYQKLWRKDSGIFAIAETAIARLDSGSPWTTHLSWAFGKARDELVAFVNNGLFLEDRTTARQLLPVDFVSIVEQAAAALAPDLADRSLSLRMSTGGGEGRSLVASDMDLLTQILSTLIQTAAALAVPGSVVEVGYGESPGTAVCRLDLAPDFELAADIGRLFDPDRTVWMATPALRLGPAILLAARVARAIGVGLAAGALRDGRIRLSATAPSYERKRGAEIKLS